MALTRYDDFDVWRAALSYELGRKGVSATDVATKAGIGRTTLYNIESGKRKNPPDFSVLQSVAQALGYTYEEFMQLGRRMIEEGGNAPEFPPYTSISTEIYGIDAGGVPCLRPAPPAMGLIATGYLEGAEVSEDDLWLFLMPNNTMAPHIHQKQVLFVNYKDVKVQSGMAYLIQLGEELTVRYLENTPMGLRIRAGDTKLTPLDLSGDDAKALHIYGRVVFQQGPAA